MNKNYLYLFFILFFMTVCFSFSLGMFFTEQPKPRANEILTPKPVAILPDGSVNKEYLKNVTDYTADHFAFRTDLITIHNAILSKVFRTSASDDVILGKQNWLFYKQTEHDYIGKNILSDNDIENIAHTLHMIQQYVESQNAQFLFVIAPNKNSLYSEYMPDNMYTIRNESNAQNLMNALQKQNVNYIDLFTIFRQKNEVLYYQLDSHWNNKGAALAYDSIMSALGIYHTNWYDMDYSIQKNHKGDLYEMLYPKGKQLENDIVFERQFDFQPDNEIHAPDDIQIDTTNQQKQHSLLMFRDSFGNNLYPFFADGFGHSRFSRKMPYTLTMMEEVCADVVILEIVERNISNLAQYAPVLQSPLVELHTADAIPMQCDIDIEITESELEGYCCIKGSIGEYGNIYIQWQNECYEAFTVGKSQKGQQAFTAYVPEGVEQHLKAIFVEKNGVLYQCLKSV
ncbi:hypothetical protein AAK894_06540 [Lachnospiraceae bacterium 46-61]